MQLLGYLAGVFVFAEVCLTCFLYLASAHVCVEVSLAVLWVLCRCPCVCVEVCLAVLWTLGKCQHVEACLAVFLTLGQMSDSVC